MNHGNLLTLKATLDYNEEGTFTYKDTGDIAGEVLPNGYIKIKFKNGKKNRHTLAHRLAWQWYNGVISDSVKIVHIDGDKLNNRLDNLMIK